MNEKIDELEKKQELVFELARQGMSDRDAKRRRWMARAASTRWRICSDGSP